MTTRYALLHPLGLAVGFGAAALIAMILFFAPMGFSLSGMHGYGMMTMMGRPGSMMGWGAGVFVVFWTVVVSAVAGAVVASVYNATLASAKPTANTQSPKPS